MAASTLAAPGRRAKKGDVIGAARIAGIMAAKKTADLIPLCHPLALTKVASTSRPTTPCPAFASGRGARRRPTGVEMEALTAVSVACLTIYDMPKAIDRGMRIEEIGLIEKRGGKSGDWRGAAAQGKRRVSAMITVAAGAALSVEEALARVLAAVAPLGTPENVPLEEAYGRVLAPTSRRCGPSRRSPSPPWTAMRCAPPIARSGARLARDRRVGRRPRVQGAARARARRCASSPARRCPKAPTPSSFRRMPSATATASALARAARRRHPRERAWISRAGETLIAAGPPLTPRDVALAAATNHAVLPVRRRAARRHPRHRRRTGSARGTPGPAQIVASQQPTPSRPSSRRRGDADRPRDRPRRVAPTGRGSPRPRRPGRRAGDARRSVGRRPRSGAAGAHRRRDEARLLAHRHAPGQAADARTDRRRCASSACPAIRRRRPSARCCSCAPLPPCMANPPGSEAAFAGADLSPNKGRARDYMRATLTKDAARVPPRRHAATDAGLLAAHRTRRDRKRCSSANPARRRRGRASPAGYCACPAAETTRGRDNALSRRVISLVKNSIKCHKPLGGS